MWVSKRFTKFKYRFYFLIYNFNLKHMKYYNKFYQFFEWKFKNSTLDKVSEHFKNNKVAITHKSYSSPWNWQHNANYYIKISENIVLDYRTYWAWHYDYIKKVYKEIKEIKSPQKRLKFIKNKILKQRNSQPDIFIFNKNKWVRIHYSDFLK